MMTEITTSQFRVVLWAAVSSKAQADDDKESIPEQLRKGRALCAAKGWPVAAELTVPGHSREYLSLDAAMRDIAELRELIEIAREKRANLLVCSDLNRFRSLQMAVVQTLAVYGMQVYSMAQPIELIPPDEYTYYKSDNGIILTTVGTLLSRSQLSTLRRGYAVGMPARVDRLGLHFNNVLPFGYRKPVGREESAKVIPEQVPGECATLLEMKRRYLAGASLEDVCTWLNGAGVTSPRGKGWTRAAIAYMLTNPFYAGYVARGKNHIRRDLLTGQHNRSRRPRAEWVLAEGQHAPLWTPDEYRELVDVHELRGAKLMGKTSNPHRLSRLMVCEACGGRLKAHGRMKHTGDTIYRCYAGWMYDGHARVHETTALAALREALALVRDGSGVMPEPETNGAVSSGALIERALADNDDARARYQRLAGRGLLGDDDLAARLAELKAERVELERQLRAARTDDERAARRGRAQAEAVDLLANFDSALRWPPERFNARLIAIIDRIRVGQLRVLEVVLRG